MKFIPEDEFRSLLDRHPEGFNVEWLRSRAAELDKQAQILGPGQHAGQSESAKIMLYFASLYLARAIRLELETKGDVD